MKFNRGTNISVLEQQHTLMELPMVRQQAGVGVVACCLIDRLHLFTQ